MQMTLSFTPPKDRAMSHSISRVTQHTWPTKIRGATLAAVITVTVAGCGGDPRDEDASKTSVSKDTLFQAAYENCTSGEVVNALTDEPMWQVEDRVSKYFQVADEGRTFIADSVGSDMVGFIGCFLTEFDTPRAIVAAMDTTTSLMGRQEQSDGDLTYQWTYHPDNGMNLIVTDASTS